MWRRLHGRKLASFDIEKCASVQLGSDNFANFIESDMDMTVGVLILQVTRSWDINSNHHFQHDDPAP